MWGVCMDNKDKNYYLLNEDVIEYFPIKINSGHNQLKISSQVILRQFRNGLIGFDSYDKTIYNKYYIVGYEWNGARYSVHTTNRTSGTGVGGKLIGTSGLVTGSGKTSGVQKEIEEDTIAFMDLQSFETGEIQKISFYCNTRLDAKIKCMKIFEPKDSNEISNNFSKLLNEIEENKRIDEEQIKKNELEKQLQKKRIKEEKELKRQKVKQEKEERKNNNVIEQKTIKNDKQRNTSVFAIVGFIVSIISLLISCIILGIIPGIIALILCIIALTQDKYKNKILAKIGLGLSIASIVISIIVFCICIFVPTDTTKIKDKESYNIEQQLI